MPNLIYTQTAPGVNGTDGIGSETTPPSIRRWSYAFGLWNQVRLGKSRRQAMLLPPRVMATPALLTVQHTSTGRAPGTGLQPIFSPINFQGDSFTNTANATIQVINNSGQGVVVTITADQACNQGYFHNYSVSVPSNGLPTEIGPFDFHYNNTLNVVQINYAFYLSLVSGVTIAVVAP